MKTLNRRPARLMLAAASIAGAALPAAASAATRTWVSGVGDDANPCSRTAPCKTFAGAISKTDAGGEIDALDPGGFGGVTITKAITIDGGGFEAGVLVAGTNGITINAAATDDVILRGINIEGLGTGLNGIRIQSARNVQVADSTIHGFLTAGISLNATVAGAGTLLLDRTSISGSTVGLDVAPVAPHTDSVFATGGAFTANGTGVRVATGGTAWLRGMTIFGNTTGLSLVGSGTATAYADTAIVGNGTNGTPTSVLTLGAPGPAGAVGPAGPAGLSGPTGASGPQWPAASGATGTVPVARILKTSGAATGVVTYTLSLPAQVSLIARRGSGPGTVVASMRGVKGSNTIRWNRKISGRKALKGTYTLTLIVGGTASGTAKVNVA